MSVLESTVRRFLYHPSALDYHAPLPRQATGAREVFLESRDGSRIHGIYWPPPPGRPAVLYLHGNAETVYEWWMVRPELAALDCGLLLIDYPGYGKSSGVPTEQGLYASARAGLEFLRGEVGDAARQVVVHGKSLGGAVATHLATEVRVAGVVLESTFRSVPHMARRMLPLIPVGSMLRTERYDSLARMANLHAPVLVIHGARDQVVPRSEGAALYDAANPPKEMWMVPGAGHNDVARVAGTLYGERLRGWLDSILVESAHPDR